VAMAGCVIREPDEDGIVVRAENSQTSFYWFCNVVVLKLPAITLLCHVHLLICVSSSIALYNSIKLQSHSVINRLKEVSCCFLSTSSTSQTERCHTSVSEQQEIFI
jgi:hypothetical protein